VPFVAVHESASGPKRRFAALQKCVCFRGYSGHADAATPPALTNAAGPEMLRTAIATAFFCPTSTTSRLPRVTPV
jgi:hypothetical protein